MYYIDYTAFSPTGAQQTINIRTLQCARYMFRPLHGHAQGGLQQRNSVVPDSVKEVLLFGLNAV
jgi:hypothetical protein